MTDIKYYLYVASTPYFGANNQYKIGLTTNLHQRLSNYKTGLPPTESNEITYRVIILTDAKNKKELKDYEAKLHKFCDKYKMEPYKRKHSEWFNITKEKIIKKCDLFISKHSDMKLIKLSDVEVVRINTYIKQLEVTEVT